MHHEVTSIIIQPFLTILNHSTVNQESSSILNQGINGTNGCCQLRMTDLQSTIVNHCPPVLTNHQWSIHDPFSSMFIHFHPSSTTVNPLTHHCFKESHQSSHISYTITIHIITHGLIATTYETWTISSGSSHHFYITDHYFYHSFTNAIHLPPGSPPRRAVKWSHESPWFAMVSRGWFSYPLVQA